PFSTVTGLPTGLLSSSKNVISVPITLSSASLTSAVETSAIDLPSSPSAPSTFPKFSSVEVSVSGSYTVTISSPSTILTSVIDLPSRPSSPSSLFSNSLNSCSELPSLPGNCSQIS